MQLVWADVLKNNEWITSLMDIYFDAMGDRNTGKASTHFQERAEELGHIVLTNKSYQKTRFVRALLRGLTAAMRNLTTIVSILAAEYDDAALRYNNTRGKEMEKTIKDLRSPKNLLLTIGMMQLLEIYASVSLEAQHSFHFPVQVWHKITSAKDVLSKLSDNWSWCETPLKIGGIGSPRFIIETLKHKGTFTPYVPEGSVRKNTNPQYIEELVSCAADEVNLFDEETQLVLEFAGSLSIEGFSDDLLESVEHKLQSLAGELKTAWDRRQSANAHHLAVLSAFGQVRLAEDGSDNSNISYIKDMAAQLKMVIDSLPQAELFSVNDSVEGFIEWNKFWKKSLERSSNLTAPLSEVQKIYEKWVKSSDGQYSEFKDLYEICMIRSMSEAMAETVGSMMNQHCGRGRHLMPAYFSMELVLRFNLGPLHLMDKMIKDILKCESDKGKEYIRRVTRVDKLVTKDTKLSAAMNTFRKKAEDSSRFPTVFWTDWNADE